MTSCSVQGCGSDHHSKGFCHKHYQRYRTHGDPLFTKGIPHGEAFAYFETVVLLYEGNDCLIWPYCRRGGYGSISIDGKMFTVSRLVCEKTHGAPPTPHHEAAHSCGKGSLGCVTKNHLLWKTRKANQADKIIHGTHNRGERQGRSKLTEAQVSEIRSLRGKEPQTATAKRFGVSQPTIAHIHTGRSWTHHAEESQP